MVNHLIDHDGYLGRRRAHEPDAQVRSEREFPVQLGRPGGEPGRLNCSHGITTDQLGNLYLADCFAGRVQKFEPSPAREPIGWWDRSSVPGTRGRPARTSVP